MAINWELRRRRLAEYHAQQDIRDIKNTCKNPECEDCRSEDSPPEDCFAGDEPYPMSPHSDSFFEDEEKEKRLDSIAKAVISVDWEQILEKK